MKNEMCCEGASKQVEGQVEEQIRMLDKIISNFKEITQGLEERLSSVLSHDNGQKEPASGDIPCSEKVPLAAHLEAQVYDLGSSFRRLEGILSRVEL